ncbi:SPP1 family predicted phage head-tail adaptor [Methylopila capsulata]|uniref:SPP1 family predicted phage head-tail adaptor n=1 Tax=Methylopila capsulata TaxID=61654 RepID=A0A9W6IWC8_9HYPH|nr:phage head closure protein [Methylopila capsulata]MBM7852110.1 SPP1 family predicted phage head-tail adaptor [Methylopila capsulata]GLK56316.1 hypothetical protein GCM10008170_23350 [Methylopila capsulata]
MSGVVALPLGALRRRVEILAPVETPDGAGGVARSFASAGETFASVEPLNAAETQRGFALGLARLYRITLRARGDLTGGHRVLWRERTFEVLSVRLADADGRFEELLCEETTP